MHAKSLDCVPLFVTQWTVALQDPLSVGLLKQEYQRGLPGTPPGHLPNPVTEPESLMYPALASEFLTISATWEALYKGRSYEKSRV